MVYYENKDSLWYCHIVSEADYASSIVGQGASSKDWRLNHGICNMISPSEYGAL